MQIGQKNKILQLDEIEYDSEQNDLNENAEAIKNHQNHESYKIIKLKERNPKIDDCNSDYENQQIAAER